MMVSFGGLRDLKDSKFSESVGFFFVMRFQRRSGFFHYEFSTTVGFGGL